MKSLSRKTKLFLLLLVIVIIGLVIAFVRSIVINTELSQSAYVNTGHFPEYPQYSVQGKTPEQISQIKRGEYLVKASDCIACHTLNTGDHKPFSGGLPMQTPFGVVYSPNITPDKETGIGTWTDEQFINAMHNGIAPDGSYYYPAFPYLYFSKITTPDVLAIKSYLNVIPPVRQENRANDMVWPFNLRFLQLGWRILFFNTTGPYQNDPSKSKAWNLGAYLVQGPGHCAMCHTPAYYILSPEVSLGAPITKYNLTGANIEGYLAPNITKSNLGAIPDSELLKIFTEYTMAGGAPVQGPMYEAIHDSLKQLPTDDLVAILIYLKTVESELPPQGHATETAVGESIYNNYCSACHQAGIGGAPRLGDALSWQTLAKSGIEKLYSIAIHGGGNMPAKGTCITCSDFQIRLAVDYMVANSIRNPGQVAALIKLSPQQIYQNNCSSCHSNPQSTAPQLGDKKAWQPIAERGFFNAYKAIMNGQNGHPPHAGCPKCTDKDVLNALKYLMQEGSPLNNYNLW